MSENGAKLLSDFSSGSGTGVFSCAPSRTTFAEGVRKRVANPGLISQKTTSLCGPAAFLFCLATKSPGTYTRYALELYAKGKTKLGSLTIEPGKDCRLAKMTSDDIDPVDWVTLASLRDSSNSLWDCEYADDRAAGVTFPSTLASWFSKCGAFSNVRNDTNLLSDKELSTLLTAGQARSTGSYVCLFISANVLDGTAGGSYHPDHWVVLNSEIRLNGNTTMGLAKRGTAVDDDDALQDASVSFEMFTWGDGKRPLMMGGKKINVNRLLEYFYGYVSAK